MRTAFIETLSALAHEDHRITLIVGDLGFGVVTDFREQLPKQFVNAGVAEQNMTGLAAGMALSKRIVFTYSIANFPTIRCLEQVRNDVCYHRANVKIVAVGGGVSYGALGFSHHATEDIAVMRSLPGLAVFAPGDPLEAAWATRAAAAWDGPVYLRLGRANEPRVHESFDEDLEVGKAITVREGEDVALISTGVGLPEVVEAAELLEASGVGTRVISMPSIKPLDEAAIVRSAEEVSMIFSVEEHSVTGGLGGAIAEVLAEAEGRQSRFQRIGFPDSIRSLVGDREFLRKNVEMDAAGIARQVQRAFEGSS